jgi:hypothetical protein
VKVGTRAEASMEVAASPQAIYDLVTDITNMGRWSPECRSCEWTGEVTTATEDAHFRGRNRRGLARWTTIARVVVADPGREFAFATSHRGQEMTQWRYQFKRGAGTTTVTESFEMLRDMPWYLKLADRLLMSVTDRQSDLQAGMAQTLGSIKAAIEAR